MPRNNQQPQITQLTPVCDGVWTFRFPLHFFGLQLGRRVSLLRLADGRLVIHSSGPFTKDDVRAIRTLGRPEFLLDATTMHDTFSEQACAALPESAYYAPEKFPYSPEDRELKDLQDLESATGGELQVVRLDGMRFLTEYACFHPASRTLLLCDLLFNLDQAVGYTRWAMRYVLGVKQWPAIDRPVRWSVKNRKAFEASLQRIFRWDFDRIIVAHGSIIETGGKAILHEAIVRAGFQVELGGDTLS